MYNISYQNYTLTTYKLESNLNTPDYLNTSNTTNDYNIMIILSFSIGDKKINSIKFIGSTLNII